MQDAASLLFAAFTCVMRATVAAKHKYLLMDSRQFALWPNCAVADSLLQSLIALSLSNLCPPQPGAHEPLA